MTSRKELGVEVAIAKVLRFGVIVSSIVIAGGVLLVPSGMWSNTTCPATLEEVCTTNYGRPVLDLGNVLSGVASMNALSIIEVGVVVLLAVPFFRVAASVLMFVEEKDWQYVAIASLVLTVLLISTFVVAPYEAGK